MREINLSAVLFPAPLEPMMPTVPEQAEGQLLEGASLLAVQGELLGEVLERDSCGHLEVLDSSRLSVRDLTIIGAVTALVAHNQRPG